MPEPDLKRTAQRHQRVRRQHFDELAQDYVEAIHELLSEGRVARVTDLQGVFGVSHVSVIRALKRFESRGLLVRAGDEGIQLTPEGTQMAEEAAVRHELVVRFLRTLGVSEARAQADAEGIEHHLSSETLEAMRRVTESGPVGNG